MGEPNIVALTLADLLVQDEGQAAFTQLQAFCLSRMLASPAACPRNANCEMLGVSRGALRKALAIAE